MTRFTLFAALCIFATPTLAADKISKAEDCGYQADVVAAIQVARLDRVKEAKLAEAIAQTDPTWPDKYNNAITVLGGPIYQIKRRDLKKVDLGVQWKEACLSRE
jgi:hypothetical protein